MEKFSIVCPCCEAAITIDAVTGAILSHEEKKKVLGSFEDLKGNLDKQNAQKDRERLLEEKFREAMKRAGDDKDKPFKNPLDMD
jgi:arginyl-tRNA--protein-N-Asp/Glu arginylyltransferase